MLYAHAMPSQSTSQETQISPRASKQAALRKSLRLRVPYQDEGGATAAAAATPPEEEE